MGYYWKPYGQAIERFFDWVFADIQTKKIMLYVPKYCWYCHLLGVCRDENNKWKCKEGCLIINSRNDRTKYK